ALSTCTFQPNQVGPGSGDSLVTLTISTTAAVPRGATVAVSVLIFTFPVAGLLWIIPVRRSIRRSIGSAWALLLMGLLLSCGGGLQGGGGGGSGSPGTPPGTYSITITATSGSVTHTAPSPPISLTVTP